MSCFVQIQAYHDECRSPEYAPGTPGTLSKLTPEPITDESRQLNARCWRTVVFGLLTILLSGIHAAAGPANEHVASEVLGGDECFMFSQLLRYRVEGDRKIELPLQLVINDEQVYRGLFTQDIMRQSCADTDLSKVITDVDFSKKTVLGLWTSGSCADTGFERRVLRDDSQKVIIYSVAVVGPPIVCWGPGLESLNLIAMPKIPNGYRVVFETFHK